ncbi:hypothetical protein KKF47_03585 [Patescibacteria group bacterium]|nr:hypothetical protein [Patescibacteria group bacterium]MBU4467110.1 hypothetical protein [Patescibacteria group bacterium]MCG2699788.1 hypothetical protein [Candidatus Parcubacteria bacterium]
MESKWEKYKKHDTLDYISIDEIAVLAIGLIVFLLFPIYRIVFIIFIILWYWLKIRHYERKIIEKEREIYNVYYDKCRPVAQLFIDAETKKARKPLRYDLKQLQNKRKFLVDKFVVINLILIVLIELFIKK